jgi:hypothetical protein
MADNVDTVDDLKIIVDYLNDNWKKENTFSVKPDIKAKHSAPPREDLKRGPKIYVYSIPGKRTIQGLGATSERVFHWLTVDSRCITYSGIDGRELLIKIKAEILRIIRTKQLAPTAYQFIDITNEKDFSGRSHGLYWYTIDLGLKHWGFLIR